MDREILFKGKRIDNGEWVEGTPINTHIGVFMCFDENTHYCSQYGYMEIDEIVKMIPETLCQYTGLTDKNSQEIWENDILCAHGNPNDIYQVCFGEFDVMNLEDETITDKVVGWYVKVIPTEDVLSMLAPFNADMPLNEIWVENCGLEAIGNVFDNPELLEGGD